MNKRLLLGVLIIVAVVVGLVVFAGPDSTPEPVVNPGEEQVWECNGDAMMCPDGSSVGRTGPNCEFEKCPSPDATSARIETYLGGRDGGLGLTIHPTEVVSDSRCPQDVQCVWAGTVELKATVETKVAHGEHVFKLGEPKTIGDLTVTLVEVRPGTKAEVKIPESSYWFVFEAKKN